MPNDQQMRIKSQLHHNSSLDKSLRPAVIIIIYIEKIIR
jgi:hypothetical protein